MWDLIVSVPDHCLSFSLKDSYTIYWHDLIFDDSQTPFMETNSERNANSKMNIV